MDIFNNKPLSISLRIDEEDAYASFSEEDRAFYSLYDINGNIVDNLENKSINVEELQDPSCLIIDIPSEANIIGEDELFSMRFVVVDYSINGSQKSKRLSYRVIPFETYTCTNDDVRNLLGVSSTVIEDSMIDIYGAYLKCKSLFDDDTLLDSSLKSYGLKSILANRAIAICSALTFRNSLMLLTPKIESDGVASQTRFTMSAEDFAKLFDDLQDELEELISDLLDEDAGSSYSPELFVVGNLTDTFTGG